jgi:alkanesulfonate monooxygenase SsuD/methylene tetrahydromethanopterin reductase-like flavin-dependent oxidoreductase (luciferase family)
MEFGIFDHLDRSGLPLKEYYEARLKLIEAYDRAGFYAYHVAEHHSTPLGMAPSPSVFLSAIAQRTRRLRFGPLVYAVPLHHPLRLIEEICMLDQLSGGRLEIGFGRGSSSIEIAFYGQEPKNSQRIYAETVDVILQSLSTKKLNFHGEFCSFDDVPLEIEPLQKPHPPVWYGVHSVESAERAARRGLNIVSLDSARQSRSYADIYREVWDERLRESREMPKIGISRFIVVGENEKEALGVGRRAYLLWRRSFYHLYKLRGGAPAHERPNNFDEVIDAGLGIAGTATTVASFLRAQLAESHCTYVVGQFAFGDLSLDESLRSVKLFAAQVMPTLRANDH